MDAILQFDENLINAVQQLHSDWLTIVMKGITLLGEDGIFIIAVCLALLAFRRTRRLGIICSLTLALTFLCCNGILKPLIDRERPFEIFSSIIQLLPHPGDASFPSGHTANFAAPVIAAYMASRREDACLGWKGEGVSHEVARRVSAVGLVLAIFVGFSRIYLGVHYPTDVIGSFILAIIVATLVTWAVRKYEARRGIWLE